MTDHERLLELTQAYLKSLVSSVSGFVSADFDSCAPFGELGVDSFRVLKIIKALEADFGTLPKTLLFENFNISDLSRYFVGKHAQTLSTKFAKGLQSRVAPDRSAATQARAATLVAKPAIDAKAKAARPRASAQPLLILESKAYAHPELGEWVRDIFKRYKNEGSVSRGTRNIAPNLFIGSEKKGFIHYGRSKNIILAYAYTGPTEYFPVIATELYRHCCDRNFELNILADEEVTAIGAVPVSSTPFGALQRILNIQSFTLQGAAMRRLRYQVSKFEKAGHCRTEEYRHGTNQALASSIAGIIDQWCAARTMVNPLIYIVKEEILAGTLNPEHRIFLTYVDEVLQNVILISPLCSEQNGYLMDLEFYTESMPLGGLEFAIVKIIEILAAERCEVLSLGGTYGCKLQTSANADPEVDKILDDLRMQNIFNDEGNLQFKNKFRPENKAIFLCRPVGQCTPDNVVDIIMMIADPLKMQTPDDENQGNRALLKEEPQPMEASECIIEGVPRSVLLSESHFNPLNIPPEHVEFDLKTDSWAQLRMPAIENQTRHLHSRLREAVNLDASVKEVFPFAHFALTTSGRAAESVFYRAWARKGIVLQNLLFPTTIFHQIDKGFTPKELPHAAIFRLDSQELYKGNLNWEGLQQQVAENHQSIALVCIELSDNATGGCPVSLEHLRKVKALLVEHSIRLVMDATRVLENARFLIENETECAGRTVWQVTREILGYADAIVVSLAKDFCAKAGLIATNDTKLFHAIEALVIEAGCSLDAIEKKVVALALQDRRYIESQTLRRMENVKRIWACLKNQGIPVVQPAGGHCILIDVKQIPELRSFRYPVPAFAAWLYLNTGIRAGAHSVGMLKDTALNDLVRLAIPVGLKRNEVDEICDRLSALFASRKNIPEIVPAEETPELMGEIHAKYKLIHYHNLSGALVARPLESAPAADLEQSPKQSPGQNSLRASGVPTADIAVVGMAGRYPKARNLQELWANLIQERDCIESIPKARMEQRLHNAFTRAYRGGFIDDVERFDARFFNIAPKEAEVMDPQERLFLEVACEAIEDAGYYPEILADGEESRDIGVFVGAVWSAYQMLGVEEKIAGNNINPSSFLWSIANRVSYWMNLTGPSLTLDTACSASLTAISLACEALRSGECSAAIVGAVNLDLHQSKFDINSTGGSLSKDGVCRSFGKGANGYVSGEGVGALFLKPLDRALAAGDHIHGVIKSAVVRHSGRTSGYMIPGPHPQSRLISKALERANIDARSIGYIEAHGTGTELGDSIEVSALTDAFQKFGVGKQSCPIGSVKTNIGHLEAASGIVGVQKILLQMRHGQLVPSLHSAELNESIDFANSSFYVQQKVEEWKAKEVDGMRLPRRAGISAIGAGGTSGHIILEEHAPAPRPQEDLHAEPHDKIFPISARSEEQLREAVARLRDFARSTPSPCANDIAHTLQLGRKSFDYRVAVLAKTVNELAKTLTAFLEERADENVMCGHVKNAAAITGLLSDREKQDFIKLLVQSRDPRRLARLWSDGVIATWRGLDIGQSGQKTSLPTYPFSGERYWISPPRLARQDSHPTIAGIPVRDAQLGSIDSAAKDASISIKVSPSFSISGDGHPEPVKRVEKYQFSFNRDREALAGKRSSLSVEERACLFVRQMFANQLRASIDDVDDASHLMDTGITSMDMAEMTQSLKERIDPGFSPIAFFECTTVRAFSEALARKYATVFEKMTVTKLAVADDRAAVRLGKHSEASDVAPDVASKPLHVQDAQSALVLSSPVEALEACQAEMRSVFLTGATGFLGIHVLSELLSSDPEAMAHCLVRASDKAHGLERILKQAEKFELTVDPTRISVLCGDISKPRLGLSEQDWDRSCRSAQQIVHASAHVNHIEGYATFRDSAQGMKEIIRLAGTHRLKLIQFISSIAGCALKIGEELSFFEKEDFVSDGEQVYGGYGQSKWVQETYLRRASDGGIPYVIYRFGELSGSSRSGLGQTDDMLHRLLQMRLAVQCKEKISSDVLDMLPVDFAARLIVGTGKTPAAWNAIVHATHLKPYSLANLYRKAQSHGLEFKPVTRAQYLSRCYDFVRFVYSINPVNGFVLECVLRDAEGSIRNRKMMDGYFSIIFPFDQDNFRRLLGTLGLVLPEWNALIDSYLARWSREDCGFMAKLLDYQMWSQLDEAQKCALESKRVAVGLQPVTERPKGKPAGKKSLHEVHLLGSVSEA